MTDSRTEPSREAQEKRAKAYPAEAARQGRIVLNTPLRRAIFFGGLAALVLFALLMAILG